MQNRLSTLLFTVRLNESRTAGIFIGQALLMFKQPVDSNLGSGKNNITEAVVSRSLVGRSAPEV